MSPLYEGGLGKVQPWSMEQGQLRGRRLLLTALVRPGQMGKLPLRRETRQPTCQALGLCAPVEISIPGVNVKAKSTERGGITLPPARYRHTPPDTASCPGNPVWGRRPRVRRVRALLDMTHEQSPYLKASYTPLAEGCRQLSANPQAAAGNHALPEGSKDVQAEHQVFWPELL